MLVLMMSIFWGMMSYRLVNAFGGDPFLADSPCKVICSEGMIIKQEVMTSESEGIGAMQWTEAMDGTCGK